MTDSSPRPLDPESAIWNKDADEFRRALDLGWTLPFARVKEGRVQDLTLAIRVVTLRWAEGWVLLANAHPKLRENQVLFQLAIRRGARGIVKDFVDHGVEANALLESGVLPLHILAEALREQPGEPVDESDFVDTAQFFVSVGASPLEPYPGPVNPSNVGSANGHTLWTRAVWLRRWEMSKAFMPQSWDELLGMPLGLAAVEVLRQSVKNEEIGALGVWEAFVSKFLEDWMESHPEEAFETPADISLIPRLPAKLQQRIWKRWAVADQAGWTGMHDLALLGNLEPARRVLALMVEQQAPCLGSWDQPDVEGVRPCDLWEMANGRTFKGGAPMTPIAELPELKSDGLA